MSTTAIPNPEPKVRVVYVEQLTVLDLDPEQPPTFDSWDEADQFLAGTQQHETVSRWLIGQAASRLPKVDATRNFEAWCRRAQYDPGRVAVWRRMAELYSIRDEVQRFPTLTHKHWEVTMGRMSKAKKVLKATGDSALYEQVMEDLRMANDGSESSRQMVARITEREGKRPEQHDLPLRVEGVLRFGIVDDEEFICLVIVPKDAAEVTEWIKYAKERSLPGELVSALITRHSTD